MAALIILAGFVALLVSAFALVRGHLHWAHLRNRKHAALAALASFAVMMTGGVISPAPPATTLHVAAAGASVHPPTSTVTLTQTATTPQPNTPPSSTSPNSAPAPAPTTAASNAPRSPAPSAAPRPSPTHTSHTTSVVATLVAAAGGAALPDRARTPGAIYPTAGPSQICVAGYSARVRHVSDTTRRAVFTAYAIPWSGHGGYEVDHLIPLELGGSNATTNLWPEPQGHTGAGYPRKDRLENHLHDLVCAGTLPLRTAQHAIAANWVEAYTRYESQPVAAAPRPAPRPQPAPAPTRHQAPAPPAAPVAPAGATAQCNDGTYSYAAHHQGACSHHHGVRTFYK